LLLGAGANISVKEQQGRTALMLAALQESPKPVEALIARGAEVDLTDRSNRTSLTYAAAGGHVEVVAALLKAGARKGVEQSFRVGAAGCNDAVTQFFLMQGFAADTADEEGSTPLIEASANKCTAVVRRLLERGADPKRATKAGLTPLVAAAFGGSKDIV